MNLILLIALLLMVLYASLQVWPYALRIGLPPLLSGLIVGFFLIFSGSLLPGACGAYAPVAVALVTGFLCIAVVVWSVCIAKQEFGLAQFALTFDANKTGPWTFVTLLVSAVSVACLYPYALCFGKMFLLSVSPEAELGWDTVSYHLPALVEYIQTHTLWSFHGPYQSYSYGFELIYGLSMLFCRSHWSVVWGHGASVLLFILATGFICGQFLDVLKANGIVNVNRLMVQLLVQALWTGGLFSTSLDGVGNNDIFEAATVLSTFGFLLVPWSKNVSSETRKFATVLGAMSLSLALATKSPALMFTPLFLLMAVTAPGSSRYGLRFDGALARFSLPLFVVSIVLGTFFLWHNFSFYGGITDPALAVGFRDTLLHHLRDPRLFKPTVSAVMFVASTFSLLFVWRLWSSCRSAEASQKRIVFVWLGGLFVFGMAAFSYTPFGVTPDYDHNDLTRLFFQDRKAMVMYMAASLALALSFGVWVAKPSTDVSANGVSRAVKLSPAFVGIFFAFVIAVIPAIDWWWHRNWPIGLPGYEVVKALPTTNVYRWVQSLDKPCRIYSSGLRPFGLVGRNYQNELFYDLHSHILNVERESRLLSVLDQFDPDIVLISVDPHAYTGGPNKPELVEWMKTQTCFTKIYEDATVTGFKVSSKWRILLQKYKLPATPVRMHS